MLTASLVPLPITISHHISKHKLEKHHSKRVLSPSASLELVHAVVLSSFSFVFGAPFLSLRLLLSSVISVLP